LEDWDFGLVSDFELRISDLRGPANGDWAGGGVGLSLFDVHSFSPIQLYVYHTTPRQPVKQKTEDAERPADR
jgi:hypothetical protein